MLGLVFIYFIGKVFYALADRYDKSQWGFAILGIVSYYFGIFFGGMIIGVIYEFGLSRSVEDVNEMLLGFMCVPFGALACWGLYKILENRWKEATRSYLSEEVLDAELPGEAPKE